MRENKLYANIKKCRFHKKKVYFLDFIILAQSIYIENEKIEAIKNWLKPKQVKDIPVLLKTVNFYYCFIRDFNKIAGPLISILKIINLFKNPLNKIVMDNKLVVGRSNNSN